MKKLWITSPLVVQDADVLAHRHHQRIVHRQQPKLAWLQLVVRDDVAGEIDVALVRIGVFPVPLMPGDLDRQVGVVGAVLVVDQPERRDRHHHQDQHGDHRPGDFQHRVVPGLGRHRIALGVVAIHHPAEQPADEQRDEGDDDQHQVVQVDDLLLHRAERRLHADFPWARRLRVRRAARHAPSAHQQERDKSGLKPPENLHRPPHPVPSRPAGGGSPSAMLDDAWPTGPLVRDQGLAARSPTIRNDRANRIPATRRPRRAGPRFAG